MPENCELMGNTKVKCRKIEQMLPQLSRMVAMEEKSMTGIGKNGN